MNRKNLFRDGGEAHLAAADEGQADEAKAEEQSRGAIVGHIADVDVDANGVFPSGASVSVEQRQLKAILGAGVGIEADAGQEGHIEIPGILIGAAGQGAKVQDLRNARGVVSIQEPEMKRRLRRINDVDVEIEIPRWSEGMGRAGAIQTVIFARGGKESAGAVGGDGRIGITLGGAESERDAAFGRGRTTSAEGCLGDFIVGDACASERGRWKRAKSVVADWDCGCDGGRTAKNQRRSDCEVCFHLYNFVML